MAADEISMSEALGVQALGCAALGSPLYADLLAGLRTDFDAGGITHDLLADRPRPVRDAVPLRYLGAVHRLALAGDAPVIAAHYPSCGGAPGPTLLADFLAAVDEHRAYVTDALDTQVQTNEIGRAALLAGAFALLARRHGLPSETREVGASAGLISRWDHYGYDTATTHCGDAASAVQFRDSWRVAPDLSGNPTVAGRAACDLFPLDAADPDAQLRLLSFVWPDQAQRFERLRAALTIASTVPLRIDAANADAWVEANVAPQTGATTVLFHTIVWQYLSTETQHRMRAHLQRVGMDATADAPLVWLRMEPAGAVADLRLTTWPGGHEEVLATSGFHGADIDWLLTTDS